MLLPLSLDEFIPSDHKARVVNAIVDKMDLSRLYATYCTTNGQNAFDPRMLVKILFYATFIGTFSSREIESKLHTDTAFMYLAAMQKPTYRTINRFRNRFFDELIPIFEQIVWICQDLKIVGLNHVAFDGTKIKANASPKKSLTQKQLERRIRKLLGKSSLTDQEEDAIFGTGSPYSIPEECVNDPDTMKKIEQLAAAYNQLKESGESRINLTDNDSHVMKNKQALLPAYNMQTAVDDASNVIVAMDVTTEENDYHQLIPMVDQVIHNTADKPKVISADPGYATFENYAYLNKNGLYGLIPDSMHFIETHGKTKYYPKSQFVFDQEHDWYTCPAGRRMNFVRIQMDSKKQPLKLYQGNCSWCPLHLSCTKSSKRSITRHPQEELKDEMRKKLATPRGQKEYKKRITVAEGPFGNLKVNKRWIQLSHRGLKKVKGECLLHVIGHNLGVISKIVPIERIDALDSIQFLSRPMMDLDGGLFLSPVSFDKGGVCSTFDYVCADFINPDVRIINPGFVAGIMCT